MTVPVSGGTPLKRQELELFYTRIGAKPIVVLGDLMLDEYLWGRTERISPEAPVQVVEVVREELRLGGAGNVIHNLLALGCRVQVAGVVGDDADGQAVRRLFAGLQLDAGHIVTAAGRVTTRKTRVLASNQQMLRIDRENRAPITPQQEEELLARLAALLPGAAALLLSDYQKGVLTERALREAIALGRRHGLPVLVDPKGRDYARYRDATLLTPNRKETELATGIALTDAASLDRAGRKLVAELGLEALVLTRSEEGMSLFLATGARIDLPAEAREVFDVSGAGDTVLAAIGAGLAGGLTLEQAAWLANVAAGIVVGKVGTSTVSPEEILAAVGRQHLDADLKIKTLPALLAALERPRREGKTIVFTNGCFDLLHVGHVKYLQQARRLGDLLVLGLNADDSIRRLKGPTRPLIGEEERAHILAALDCVDHVVLFAEDTPLELIRAVRPHILVKGGDYTPDGVVGKEVVESYGGRVELIEFVAGKSTTGLVEKIRQQYREE